MKREDEKYVLDIQLSSDKKWDYTLFKLSHAVDADEETIFDRMYETCDEGVIEEEGLELEEAIVVVCSENLITDDDELYVCLRE